MLILPAIDLLDGKAVRLYQGSYDKVSTYDTDPVATAQRMVDAGATRVHVVDLDAARGKGAHNRATIAAIRKSVSCKVEVGGGIRAMTDVRELVDAGVDWLIVGTALVKEPDAVRGWIEAYPGRFIAGIDARDGSVKIAGWEDDAVLEDLSVARNAADMGFSAIVYTNISQDGTLAGPDIARTNAIAQVSGLPVILSGGIGAMDHVRLAVKDSLPLVRGIITGKALYEHKIDLAALCAEYPQGTGEL